jgi:hypothetical protein
MTAPRLTILMSGMIAADPGQGGATWAVLQYLLGLRTLGHDVWFVEPVSPASLVGHVSNVPGAGHVGNVPHRPANVSPAGSENATYFRQVTADFGLEQSALLLAGTRQTVGRTYEELRRAARRADVLLNVSGILTDEELTEPIPLRTYLDLDPAFNQLWQAAQGIDMRFGGHNRFVTVGQAIGQPGCGVPTCGRSWLATFQPVVLKHWPVAGRIVYDGLTTVGNWRGYGSIEHEGVFYGQKVHSVRRFVDLPRRTREKFLPALAVHAGEVKDLAALAENGWQVLDPGRVADTPEHYREFIQGSKAEFGIAKAGYVVSRCGWFSDRSACYLASGRPVLAQETGFSRFLPTGAGLFAFETVEDVLAAIDALNSDYPRHARAAREIAEEYFDAGKVLPALLQEIGATA